MELGNPPSPEFLKLQARCRALHRERSLWLGVALLAIALAVVDRGGSQVYAVAVWDATQSTFVEQAYLANRVQANQVLGALKEQARLAHPFYAGAKEAYQQAAPEFQEKVSVRRVRRVTALAPPSTTVDLPVAAAIEALAKVLKVEVDAYGIFDVQDANRKRLLVALPSKAMALQAIETRLGNVTRKVEEELRGVGHLVEKPSFLQNVEIERRRWPVGQVMTVEQAVDYLTNGDTKDSWHLVQNGETGAAGLRQIAAKYGARVDDLRQWNAGRDLTTLAVGDKLIIRRPEPPLTVLTVENRTYVESIQRSGKPAKDRVTVEIRRHNGVELTHLRKELGRRPL